MKYVILAFIFSNMVWSQNLDKHIWKNRVIVIKANNDNSKNVNNQFNLLEEKKEKLIDRKLVIYKCVDNKCEFHDFKQDSKTFKINKIKDSFSVVLIGLDGGEKHKSNQIETADVFFDLIDRMPMRRQELKNKRAKDE